MNSLIVDYAINEISNAQGRSPTYDILEAAARSADCPFSALVVEREGYDEILALFGLPSSMIDLEIPIDPKERELRASYFAIEDLMREPNFAQSRAAQNLFGARFLVSVPVKIGSREFQLRLIFIDNRSGASRPADLQQILERYAQLTASVIIQTGELAYHSKKQKQHNEYLGQLTKLLTNSPTKVLLTDENFRVLDKSVAFESFAKAMRIDHFSTLEELFLSDWPKVAEMLDEMKSENKPIDAVSVNFASDKGDYLCIAKRVLGGEVGDPSFCIDIRLASETGGMDALACDIAGDNDQEIESLLAPRPQSKVNNIQSPDNPAPLSAFLLETLVKHKRFHAVGEVAYHSLRRWRRPIKPWQISAFRNLKRNPSEAFVTAAASELTAGALSIVGAGAFDYVVPVACGNSGPGCFAEKLAEKVAAQLNIEHVEAFHPIGVTGKSHPKRNATRPKMKLRSNPKGRILLIDDVATSGSHLVEATKLLRGQASTVLPLSWIAA